MAPRKLGIRYLHLLSQGYFEHGLYSLRRMDASALFYPSTSKAKAAAAAATTAAAGRKREGEPFDFALAAMGPARLLKQVIHYRPLAAGWPYRCGPSSEVFARFGCGGGKVLCADAAGLAAVYDAEEQSFVPIPAMNSLKGTGHVAFSVSAPRAAAAGDTPSSGIRSGYADVLSAGSNGKRADTVYVLDTSGGEFRNASCFEELAYGGPREGWRWRPLPPPPFLQQDTYYGVARAATPAYAVIPATADGGGARVYVSTATAATYAFDTAAREWSKAGDWALPFAGRAEHVPELGVCVGLSSDIDNPYGIWTVDLAGAVAAAGDGAPPAARHVGLDLDPPPPEPVPGEGDPEWLLEDQALVSLGSGRLCVARFFNHYYDRYTPALAVFTGVEVVPSGGGSDGGFSLIRHKSQYISSDGATMRVL
ncbi:unnamed protein product [Urochloa decumbens]|uniref:Uncharacterized protein n=1 Tax=Urochloa decumbens TaxID=240449 RepID=A0ABC9BTB7_9POAL